MSDETRSPPAALPSPVPLDEVMLAMDVVDVLRREQALVEAELAEEDRARALVDRIQDLYASQGIEVPEAVISRGVEALRQDRFTYEPPRRTFAVRLAEVYVERGRWARRALVVLLLLGAVVAWRSWAAARRDRALVEGFQQRVAAVEAELRASVERAARTRSDLEAVGAGEDASGAVAAVLADARVALADADARLARARQEAEREPLVAADYPSDSVRLDGALEGRRVTVSGAAEALGRARGGLDAVARLRGLRGDLARVLAGLVGIEPSAEVGQQVEALRARVVAALDAGDEPAARTALAELESLLAGARQAAATRRRVAAGLSASEARLRGVDVEAGAAADLARLRERVDASLAAGDVGAAETALAAIDVLADALEQAYELRIVSRPDERSGVWRHPEDRPGARNHYVIVEARDAAGRPVVLPVTSEEDGVTRSVSRFGIRVSEQVFEAVRADKQDNGIVDRSLFGVKRRGQREVAYEFPVAGGRITEW